MAAINDYLAKQIFIEKNVVRKFGVTLTVRQLTLFTEGHLPIFEPTI